MPLKRNHNFYFPAASLILLASLTLSGCAGRPWTTLIEGDRFAATSQLVDTLIVENQSCGQCLEGDLALFYSDPLGKKALSGFLRFSMPGFYKFVVANPLGQPVLAVAGDQEEYQAVNVPEKLFLAGSIQSFGLRNDIPVGMLKGPWGEWLTARNLRPASTIIAIHEDKSQRGLWISFRHEKGEPVGISHLLLETASNLPLSRLLEDGAGRIVAEISYGDWTTTEEKCRQPREINITGLDYGINIRLKLSNVQLKKDAKRYSLPVPQGYLQQYRP